MKGLLIVGSTIVPCLATKLIVSITELTFHFHFEEHPRSCYLCAKLWTEVESKLLRNYGAADVANHENGSADRIASVMSHTCYVFPSSYHRCRMNDQKDCPRVERTMKFIGTFEDYVKYGNNCLFPFETKDVLAVYVGDHFIPRGRGNSQLQVHILQPCPNSQSHFIPMCITNASTLIVAFLVGPRLVSGFLGGDLSLEISSSKFSRHCQHHRQREGIEGDKLAFF